MKTTELGKIAIVIVVLALSYVVLRTFMIEFFALAWHIRHGTKAQLQSFDGKKYAVKVPLLAWAQVDDDGKGVSIIKRRSQIRAFRQQPEWAMMTFSVDQTYLTAEDQRRWATVVKDKLGTRIRNRVRMSLIEVGSVPTAGQELYCFERVWEEGQKVEVVPGFPMVDLTCTPQSEKRSFSASYIGTRGLLPEFYAVLKTAKRIEN